MIIINTPEEIEILRESGRRLAVVLRKVAEAVHPGVTTGELDALAEKLIRGGGDMPAFLQYKPIWGGRAYPATLCASINDEIVHGIPSHGRVLNEGDIVGLDLGLAHKGLITDMAMTVPVGEVDGAARKLINITRETLMVGIKAARGGARVGDIGNAVESFVGPYGYGIVEGLAGHGVGHHVHEDPEIPNYGKKGTGPELKQGMVVALEPMVNEGSKHTYLDKDGFTYKTKDGKRSAHFEHTILITDREAEILTKE